VTDRVDVLAAIAFGSLVALIPLGIVQRRTLVPRFEGENQLHTKKFVQQAPWVMWLGPLHRAAYYSVTLALMWLLPEAVFRRAHGYGDLGSRQDFFRLFTTADIVRSMVFALLSGMLLGAGGLYCYFK